MIKPRFSILSVLGVTLYAAVALIGAVNPESPWGFAVFPIWIFAVIWFVNQIARGGTSSAAFAEGFVITSTAIVALEMLSELPSHLSRQALEITRLVDSYEAGDVAVRYRILFMAHAGLWIACLAGVVGAWQYRRRLNGSATEGTAS